MIKLIQKIKTYSYFLLLILILHPSAYAADGKITIYDYYLKQKRELSVRETTRFESRDSGEKRDLDPKLLKLIDTIQDHFKVEIVEIISAYRSPDFNESLRKSGRNVAENSYHTKGMAADIHLDEITEEEVAAYARSLKVGGVGYYPALHMVHVDVGPVRTWTEGSKRKNWVGEKTEVPLLATVTPDRTFNKKLESLVLDLSFPAQLSDTVLLEFYQAGQWREVGKWNPVWKEGVASRQVIDIKTLNEILKQQAHGKYRLKILVKNDEPAFQYSNEFYLKRR